MVAYSFKERFINPIRVGLGQDPLFELNGRALVSDMEVPIRPKRQTIRANGKRRHARPGEIVQLYYGMRTKACYSIGVAKCTEVRCIVLSFTSTPSVAIGGIGDERYATYAGAGLNEFARADGFENWNDLVVFWRETHAYDSIFIGTLIEWEPIR